LLPRIVVAVRREGVHRDRYCSQRIAVSEKPMNLIAGVRWLLALPSRRAPAPRGAEPADMGTAFGLDAITTLVPEWAIEERERDAALKASPFEHRLHRRNGL
jgi:hypothetical protein